MSSILIRNRLTPVIPSPPHQHFLVACVIVRQSSDILPEFLIRNFAAGVDHFYIYGDDADDAEEEGRLRRLFAHFKGIVTYFEKGRDTPSDNEQPELYVQMRMYRHCLETYGHTTTWMTFIDTDEFFETYALPVIEQDPTKMPRTPFLHRILHRHQAFPVLCVRWRSALTNGHVIAPSLHHTLHDLFPRTCKISLFNNGRLAYKKTVLQPQWVDLRNTPKLDDAIHHGFAFKGPGPRTNLSCKVDLGKNLEPPIHIVHYWSRDLTSYLHKVRRGRPRKMLPGRTFADLFAREQMCDTENVRTSAHIRNDFVRRVLRKVQIYRPKRELLNSLELVEKLMSPSKELNVTICKPHLAYLLRALARGQDFDSIEYCRRKQSEACEKFQRNKMVEWPFPWVDFLTHCEDTSESVGGFFD